jgi:hypothetical protein
LALSSVGTEIDTWAEKAKLGFQGIADAAKTEFDNFKTQLTPYKTEV